MYAEVCKRKECYNLRELSAMAFPSKVGVYFIEIAFIFMSIGSLLASLLIICTSLIDVLQIFQCSSDLCKHMPGQIILFIALISPFMLSCQFKHYIYTCLYTLAVTSAFWFMVNMSGPFAYTGHLGDICINDSFGSVMIIGNVLFCVSYPSASMHAYLSMQTYSTYAGPSLFRSSNILLVFLLIVSVVVGISKLFLFIVNSNHYYY